MWGFKSPLPHHHTLFSRSDSARPGRPVKLAGLPTGRKGGYVWHDLRHEYGSFLIEQGATIQEAKEMMRHADIRTTARYLKADDDRLKQLAAKMGQRLA